MIITEQGVVMLDEHEISGDEKVWHDAAFAIVGDKYSDIYPYHNTRHTYQVRARAHLIASAAELSERECVLVRIAASFHDVCVDSRVTPGPHGFKVRDYDTTQNERASAAEVLIHSRSVPPRFLRDGEYDLIRDAILGTIPAWSPEFKTVIQSQVHADSHPIVHCVALADLGDAGMDTDEFRHTMFALFAEREVGLMQELVASQSLGEQGREMLLSWLRTQVAFVEGRKRRTQEIEIPRFSARVEPLFCAFDDSLALAQSMLEHAEGLSAEELTAFFLGHVRLPRAITDPA